MTFKKLVTSLFTLLFIFAVLSPSAFAADFTKQNELLVKKAEAQAKTLSPQLNAKTIKAINAKAVGNLSLAINQAKKSLKSYKGKQKISFEKRVKATEVTLNQALFFNADIKSGEQLSLSLKSYMKQFNANPYASEKALAALTVKNNQFSKDVARLLNKSSKAAFASKYQNPVKSEISDLINFFAINKKIDSFVSYTKSHEDVRVWDQFHVIDDAIYDDIADDDIYNTISDKWYGFIDKTFNTAEEDKISKAIKDYMTAFNARDYEAIAELLPYKTEAQKQQIIDTLKAVMANSPATGPVVIKSIETEFVYHDVATVYLTTTEIENGKEKETTDLVTLKMISGKWFMSGQQHVN
ncbi:MAG: hypothetical protein Q8898_04835 [Bacillota bacterium]|nr:hypothetical protein [Bacillota bacterium]